MRRVDGVGRPLGVSVMMAMAAGLLAPRTLHAAPDRLAVTGPPAETVVGYSAASLARKKIVIRDERLAGRVPGDALRRLGCKLAVTARGGYAEATELTIELEPGAKACEDVFFAKQPVEIGIDLEPLPNAASANGGNHAGATAPTAFPLAFDRGGEIPISATYDERSGALALDDGTPTSGAIYYHLDADRTAWQRVTVNDRRATLSGGIAPGSEVFFQIRTGGELYRVSRHPEHVEPEPEPTCRWSQLRPDMWVVELDAINPSDNLVVSTSPRVVEPNSFGEVRVRHRRAVQSVFDSAGVAVLTVPGIRGSELLAERIGDASTTSRPQPGCDEYRVAPRGGGAFTISVGLVKPGATAPISQRKIELIVLQRFAGAFRAGVAGVIGAPDQRFEARTAPGSSQAEIVRTARTPIELVLGYSVYFAGLGHGVGRGYFTHDGAPYQDSHLGMYLGFGAASVGGTSTIDFLKSLHLGLEYEVNQSLSIAFTGVVRRVDELAAGAMIGGPAGMTIPTQSHYVVGLGVVLNISPSFFRFATSVGR